MPAAEARLPHADFSEQVVAVVQELQRAVEAAQLGDGQGGSPKERCACRELVHEPLLVPVQALVLFAECES